MNRNPKDKRSLLVLAGLAVAVLAVAVTGGVFTESSVDSWYARLDRPSWAPPNWLFGPAWTALYILMALAAWLAYLQGPKPRVRWAMTAWIVQLAINGVWSPIFFGARSLGAGAVVILFLEIAIWVTIWAFWRVSRLAAVLMVPYALWVAYAFLLNLAIWRMNV